MTDLDAERVVVVDFEVPFTRLVPFAVKCMLAAVPAAMVFSLVLWLAGLALALVGGALGVSDG